MKAGRKVKPGSKVKPSSKHRFRQAGLELLYFGREGLAAVQTRPLPKLVKINWCICLVEARSGSSVYQVCTS